MQYTVQKLETLGSFSEMFSLKGKAGVVTGAAGGIGRSVAAGMAELHAKVALLDAPGTESLLCETAEVLKRRYQAEVTFVTADVTVPESVDAALRQVQKAFGSIDVAFNNTETPVAGDSNIMPFETWRDAVAHNLSGAFLVARGCAEIMKQQGRGGSIVSASSISGGIVNAGVCYGSSKAGVRHMSNALAMEYAPCGIRFNCVSFGYVLSGQYEVAMESDTLKRFYDECVRTTALGRVANLEEIVGSVLYLCTDLSSFETGTNIIVDGGVTIDARIK